jgi:hypothetical protein
MNSACADLAFTGLGYPVMELTAAAVVCIVIGIMLRSQSGMRGHRRRSIALLLALCVCVAVDIACPLPATAASADCSDTGVSLTITQSSNVNDMGPGMAMLPIVGVVTNIGSRSIVVQEVLVRVATVSKAPHAPSGSCKPRDYVVESPRMTVAQTLPPRGSVEFRGARIGFSDRIANQDACKGAIVHLAYDLNGT